VLNIHYFYRNKTPLINFMLLLWRLIWPWRAWLKLILLQQLSKAHCWETQLGVEKLQKVGS